jgi:hypothetical protein
MSATPPAPLGPDWKPWGERLVTYMTRVRSQLVTFIAGDKATDDGVIAWNRTGYPVVSKGGVFRQVILADGYAQVLKTADQTAATADTAYALTWNNITFGDGITINPADSTKIVFAEGGKFIVVFSAELKSGSSNAKSIWCWPRINGADSAGSTMKTSLNVNNAEIFVSRTAILQIASGQYLQAMFAVSDVDITITAPATTAFAPASTAATLSITRFMQ